MSTATSANRARAPSLSPSPIGFSVQADAGGPRVGPVPLSQAFLRHWEQHLKGHRRVSIQPPHILVSTYAGTPLSHAALVLFTHVWELTTQKPSLRAPAFQHDIPLPLDTDLTPRTIAQAWELASFLHLDRTFQLLMSLSLRQLSASTIWDHLAACGDFNRPGNPRHSWNWRLREPMRPLVAACVPWLYFCLRPASLDEYRIVMETVARSEPALIEETLHPLLDGLRESAVTAHGRTYQARATLVVCDCCATAHDPHSNTRRFNVPTISLEGLRGPVRCQLLTRPTGVRVLCQDAPHGVKYGLAASVYDTCTNYGQRERACIQNMRVTPSAKTHHADVPAHADARFHGTCYQCGCQDVPVHIVQLFLGLWQELVPALDTLVRSCQSEASSAWHSARARSPAPPQSPATPIS